MPHITVRGIPEPELRGIAGALKKAVVESAEVNADDVKVFYSPVRRVDEAEEVAADVYWMPRSQALCDSVALAITGVLKDRGAGFVQVTFTEFPGSHFYENCVHY